MLHVKMFCLNEYSDEYKRYVLLFIQAFRMTSLFIQYVER